MGNISIDAQHQEDLKRIANFRLLDDDFMTKVFDGQIKETELVLRIILDMRDLNVVSVTAQKEIKNLQGRSARLDVFAIDSNGKLYNIEVQRADHGAGAKRARFNSSLIDANAIKPGDKHEKLAETFVVFITESDVLGAGLPVYHIERVIRETGELFDDGTHIVYANGAYQDDETDFGRLMHDFRTSDPNAMYHKELADRTRHFKETEEGRSVMCKAMEEMRIEAAEKAISNYREELVAAWFREGKTRDEIASLLRVPVELVNSVVGSED